VTTASLVKASCYRDSVVLLRLARELKARAGVDEVAVLMATAANKELLEQARLLTAAGAAAGPSDLVIAVRADPASVADAVLAEADAALVRSETALASGAARPPRTLDAALRRLPEASLALISVPGPYAAAEARRALRRGLHVMLFSDNVSLDDEVALKQQARAAGLLLMGPDCGTAIIGGTPLGFANVVPRGAIGIVAASGTGLQQVSTLLASLGEGLSHAIGVGGRDASAPVGGLMTLAAIDLLAADRGTEVLIVVGKPAPPEVRERVETAARNAGKPVVLAQLGREATTGSEANLVRVTTLEDAAHAAAAVRQGRRPEPVTFTQPAAAVRKHARDLGTRLDPARRGILGLFAGGTLAHEARLILGDRADARIEDLGDDHYTVSRPHPMLDPSLRIEMIEAAASDPRLAVLLIDVVLGHGSARDPAGDLAPALARAVKSSAVVASVVGTAGDPQGLAAQIDRLEGAGAWVLPSNAQAARAAALIADRAP
jgi:FdrA protein